MIMGTEEPEEGNITIANHVVMRYLPQHPEFAADKSSLECVLQGNVTEENRWSIESEAKTMMTRLGIQDFTQPAGQLSGGQRKRLALISALLSPADILLLDEPMANLDPVVKTDIWELLIRTIEKENISIIISTHLVEEVNDITDYIGLLDNGRLVKFGDREQILHDDLGNKNKNLRELLEEENG